MVYVYMVLREAGKFSLAFATVHKFRRFLFLKENPSDSF